MHIKIRNLDFVSASDPIVQKDNDKVLIYGTLLGGYSYKENITYNREGFIDAIIRHASIENKIEQLMSISIGKFYVLIKNENY